MEMMEIIEIKRLQTEIEEKQAAEKIKIKKSYSIYTNSMEKTDITRRTNKHLGTVMNVNPLRHHMDLLDQFNQNKNLQRDFNPNYHRTNTKKFETAKQLSIKLDMKEEKTNERTTESQKRK